MQRRRFLRGTAAACAAGLAGCMGGEGGPDAATPARSPTQSDSAVAADWIQGALDSLEEAGDAYDQEAEKFDRAADFVDFRTGRIEAHIGEAEGKLDEAEEYANAEQQKTIDELRNAIDWFRSMVRTLEEYGAALDESEVGMSYYDNDRFADAAEQMAVALDHMDNARHHLTVAEERFDRIDTDHLGAELGEILDIEDAMSEMEVGITNFEIFLEGFRHMTLGFGEVLPAAEAYDAERWDEAASGFQDANDHFVVAESTFREGEDDADGEMRTTIIEFTCMAGAMADASRAGREASDAASENNWSRANEKHEEFEQAMENLDNCG